ncbi:MAG: hypothetical protein JW902_18225 [Syntrophaceae bacterium]|nr:hypothetical protein [Syntrophaceae bacterium]
MKKQVLQWIMVCFVIGWNAYSTSVFTQTLEEFKQASSYEKEQQFRAEIERLRSLFPEHFVGRSVDAFKNSGPSLILADLFFLTIDVCEYDLPTLHREFPAFSAIYQPVYLGDLNNDGQNEALTVSDMEPAVTDIVIFQQHADSIDIYEQVIDVYRMNVTVKELPSGEKHIVARSEEERRIPIKGTNNLLTLEYAREIVLHFTGEAFEEVRPLMIVDERIVLDE